MSDLGEVAWRFRVVARPDPAVERRASLAGVRAAVLARGAQRLDLSSTDPVEFRFEIQAGSPEAACELVADIFQPIYGRSWQAELSPVRVWPTAACNAAWN